MTKSLRTATLISYPVGTDEGGDIKTVAYRPPLGLLVVADELEKLSVSVRILDIAVEWVKYLDSAETGSDFALYIASLLSAQQSEFYGFSTIAGTMPLSVRIAQELSRQLPDQSVKTGFGGPGASAVAIPLLNAISEIDFVMVGEVEGALPDFVSNFHSDALWEVPNLVWRSQPKDGALSDSITVNPAAPIPLKFPMPDLTRWSYNVGLPVLPIEMGRGCPFSCQFCSTNDFFRKKYRLKSPGEAVQEFSQLLNELEPLGLEFVHDLFTIRKNDVAEICNAIIASGLDFPWSCSSHINCCSETLLELMAKAGCRSIFFGVESGSARMQRTIKKNVKLGDVIPTAVCCSDNEIAFNYGVIFGYPEETYSDLSDTVNLVVDLLSIRETLPAVGLLSPLGGTPYYTKYKNNLKLDSIPTKVSFQGKVYREDEFDLISRYPDVFPEFYHFDSLALSRTELKYLEDFFTGAHQKVRYLLVALRRLNVCFLDVCLKWFAFAGADRLNNSRASFYASWEFRPLFIKFYLGLISEKELCHYERDFFYGIIAIYDVNLEELKKSTPEPKAGPALLGNICIRHSGISMSRLPNFLDKDEPIPKSIFREVSYIHRLEENRLKTIEVSRQVGIILESCDGKNNEPAIIEKLAQFDLGVDETIVDGVLNHYRSDTLISIPNLQICDE